MVRGKFQRELWTGIVRGTVSLSEIFFQDLVTFPPPKLAPHLRDALMMPPSE